MQFMRTAFVCNLFVGSLARPFAYSLTFFKKSISFFRGQNPELAKNIFSFHIGC